MAEFKNKQYMFTFEEGGWNTVWAKTLPGAKRQAIKDIVYKSPVKKVQNNYNYDRHNMRKRKPEMKDAWT